MAHTSVFVILDGIDGCGKSTQAKRLVEALIARRVEPPLHLREPGSSALGERIRALLLARELEISAAAEVLLFAAARRTMLDELVTPALAAGRDVVCERFHASTFAYQSVAGGVAEEQVLGLLNTWAGSPRPDLTLILDVDPEQAASRRGGPGDRIEDRGLEFQRAVARGFRRFAQLDPRARLIDGGATSDVVALRVLDCVEELRSSERARG
jgi:dTMP kinase